MFAPAPPCVSPRPQSFLWPSVSSKGPHYSVHLIFLEKEHLPTFAETERLCAFTGIHIICAYKINACLNLVNCAVCLRIISVSAGGYYLRQTKRISEKYDSISNMVSLIDYRFLGERKQENHESHDTMYEQGYADVKDDYYEILGNLLDVKCLIPWPIP